VDSQAILAWATLALAVATCGIMVFNILQLKTLRSSIEEAGRARSASVLLKIYEVLHELRPKRHQLYAFPNDFNEWNSAQNDLADYVGVQLQWVSFLCVKGIVDPYYVMDGNAKVFAQCWDKLEGFILNYRLETNEPAQRKHFELFAQMCRRLLSDPPGRQQGSSAPAE